MMKVDLNKKKLEAKLRKMSEVKSDVMPKAYAFFKEQTPVNTGNAKRKTRLDSKLDIVANYPYAKRLDEGYSRQAPQGMSDPTIDKIIELVNRYLKKI